MKRLHLVCFVLCMVLAVFFPVSVFAEEITPEDLIADMDSVLDESAQVASGEVVEGSEDVSASEGAETPDSIPEPVVVESPAYAYDNGAFLYETDDVAIYGSSSSSVYPGTWSGSVLDYFAGVMRKHSGVHYVAFRSDRYDYWLYYGKGLSVDGSIVSGTADFLHYNSYSDAVSNTRGSGYVSVDCSIGFVYTDLVGSCSELEGCSNGNYSAIMVAGLCVALALWVLTRIWWRGR